MGVFASSGDARTFDYQAGDVGYVPFAAGKGAGELMAPLGKARKQRVDPLEQGRNPRFVGEHGGAEGAARST